MRRRIRKKLSVDTSAPHSRPGQPQRRRGATALEYVIVASLILVVVIVAVQHLGVTTSKLLSNSAKATAVKP